MEKTKGENTIKIKPLLIGFGVILIVWILSYIAQSFFISDWTDRGTFGDAFGSVNSLFSGLAFAGIIYTMLLQRQDLKLQQENLRLQRDELELTRNELKRSADAQEKSGIALASQITALQLTAKASTLNTLIDYYNKQENLYRKFNDRMANSAKEKKDKYLFELEVIAARLRE